MNNLFDKFQLWLEKRKQVKMNRWAITRAKGKWHYVWRVVFKTLVLLFIWLLFDFYFFFNTSFWNSGIIYPVIFLLTILFCGRRDWQAKEEKYQAFFKKKKAEEARIKWVASFMAKE